MIDLIRSWRRKPEPEPPPAEIMAVEIHRGRKGRYRLNLYGADGELVLLSPVRGYATWTDARRVAKRVLGARFEMRTADAEGGQDA